MLSTAAPVLSDLASVLGPASSVLLRSGLDVLAVSILIGKLYRRRHNDPDLPVVYAFLNLGLFAALVVITAGHFPAGVGFGLFGVLSIIRLRSTAFTVTDVAYAFLTLVLALLNGLENRNFALVIGLNALLLGAAALIDAPGAVHTTRVVRLTLDRIYPSTEVLTSDVTERLGVVPDEVDVLEIDYVRETTRVVVRYPATTAASVPEHAGAEL